MIRTLSIMDISVKMYFYSVSVILLLVAASCEGLRCYSCFGTGGSNRCEKYETYEDSMAGNDETLKKNCTSPHNETCIIETYAILGQTVSHIRDCNNGATFSFNSSDSNAKGAYDRLYDLDTNNETSCVWDGQHLVCLSKCVTDFCNGPELEEITSGGSNVMNTAPVFALLLQIFLFILRKVEQIKCDTVLFA